AESLRHSGLVDVEAAREAVEDSHGAGLVCQGWQTAHTQAGPIQHLHVRGAPGERPANPLTAEFREGSARGRVGEHDVDGRGMRAIKPRAARERRLGRGIYEVYCRLIVERAVGNDVERLLRRRRLEEVLGRIVRAAAVSEAR